MRHTPFLLLAAASLAASAAERPRYGGVLRVEIQAAWRSLEPAEADERFAGSVFETLTVLNDRPQPQPGLAVFWRSQQGGRRWEFRLRRGVVFHDHSALTPSAAATALSAVANGWTVTPTTDGVAIQSEMPQPELPAELAKPRYAVVARGADGALSGTGPFRVAEFEPGRRVVLQANEEHWEGRPFLDEIRIEMGRSPQQQALDLELGKADLVETGPAEPRRLPRDRLKLWSSAPVTLLALAIERVDDTRLREAIALSIDRVAIHTVLLQRQGEIAGAILPQWISGYAFLFPAARDVARAKELAPPNAPALVIGYDASDPLARRIAERISVNAFDAGLRLHAAASNGPADLKVVRQRVGPSGGVLNLPGGSAPEERYAAERAMLDEFRLVPLAHVPDVFASRPAVQSWRTPGLFKIGQWQLDDLWLSAGEANP